MAKSSKKQLADRLVGLMERMSVQMRATSPEEWSDLEVTMPQARTLVLLSQRPQRVSDIAAYLGSSLSSVTSMIDRLVNKQLVERIPDPADRRVVTCQLTPRGREEVERFFRIGRMKIEAVADLLSVGELKTVVRAMEIISAALDRQAGPGWPGLRQVPAGGNKDSTTSSRNS